MKFVFFDDNFDLSGATIQDTPPDWTANYVQVSDDFSTGDWPYYRLNFAHDGVELIPVAPPQPPTLDQVAAQYLAAVDILMDTTAKGFGYNSMLTAVSYAEEPADLVFQAEGKALRRWRSLVYRGCYDLFAQAGTSGQVPTIDQVMAALPTAPMQADVRAAVATQGVLA